MLLPTFSTAGFVPVSAILLLGQEHEAPHGLFGDPDASPPAGSPRPPAFCGLFGQRPPSPATGAGDRPANKQTPQNPN